MSEENILVEEETTSEVAETAESEPVATSQQKKKKTKKKVVEEKAISVTYVGPSMKGIVNKFTTFQYGKYPKKLESLLERNPWLNELMVTNDKLPQASKELKSGYLVGIYKKAEKLGGK